MKRKQNKGFTLAELLIVVAIIAVLVAISIPIFSKQLKKARFATNQANARAAVSASVQYYYEADDSELEKVRNEKIMDGRIYLLYDCKTGKIEDLGYSKVDPTAIKGVTYKHSAGAILSEELYKYHSDGGKRKTRFKQIYEWTVDDDLGYGSTFLSDRVYPFWVCYIEADGSCSAIFVCWN